MQRSGIQDRSSTRPEVTVQVLESQDLSDHWSRLDEFEGPGYQRVVATIRTAEGDVDAWIYVLAPQRVG